jgi:S-adenosylmethionine:tRNA ribosyltransferase-isomerase
MTLSLETGFDFDVPDELTAHEPAEARGLARDGVRMVVGYREQMRAEHRRFTDLPDVLTAKDLLVVNNSGTLPAALTGKLADGRTVALHVSSAEPNERGAYLVELRRPAPDGGAARYYPPEESPARVGLVVTLPGHANAQLTERFTARLWFARIKLPRGLSLVAYLAWYGKAIRYGYVDREWPIEAYQTSSRPSRAAARCPARPGRSPPNWWPSASGAVRGLRRSRCTPASRPLRRTRPRTPSASRSPRRRCELVERTRRAAAGSSRSAPRSCARSNPR